MKTFQLNENLQWIMIQIHCFAIQSQDIIFGKVAIMCVWWRSLLIEGCLHSWWYSCELPNGRTIVNTCLVMTLRDWVCDEDDRSCELLLYCEEGVVVVSWSVAVTYLSHDRNGDDYDDYEVGSRGGACSENTNDVRCIWMVGIDQVLI